MTKQRDLFGDAEPTDAAGKKRSRRGAAEAPAAKRPAPRAPQAPGDPQQPPLAEAAPQAPRPLAVEAPAPMAKQFAATREPASDAPRVYSVSELTLEVKRRLEPPFTRVLVRGEVTGFRSANARGHLYFSIKDEGATLDVKVWASLAQRLKFKLKDGLSIVVDGALNVYAPQGRYSLIASRLEPEGVGALALAFEQLKAKLSKEGLIGPTRTRPRRPVPFLPRRIGVVTSVSGAALKDFLQILHRRHPRLSVLVADARVQGEGSAADVVRALRWLSKSDVDVIVVTRGGGSVEDLWTFNEEAVVRAVFDCPVPVVSAIGHEVDTSLCDLAADVRAPTPSAAAELLAPVLSELTLGLQTAQARLRRAVERRVLERRNQLAGLESELGDPRRLLANERLGLSEAAEQLARALRLAVKQRDGALRALTARLQRARPQAQLVARREALSRLKQRLSTATQRRSRAEAERISSLAVSLARLSPVPRLAQQRQALADARRRIESAQRQRVVAERKAVSAVAQRLDALSPLKVLGRGYAIVQRADDGGVVRSAGDVAVGASVHIRLGGDDALQADVTQVKPKAS